MLEGNGIVIQLSATGRGASKNDDCSVDIKKAKIDTECRIELRKNYSNDAYQSNKAKLTNANFE